MGLILEYRKHVLNFKFDAVTSRGGLKTKESWILKAHSADSPNVNGLGEVSTIDRLSFDHSVDFESELEVLKVALARIELPGTQADIYKLVGRLVAVGRPAVRFGLETALLDLLHGGGFKIFDNHFFASKQGIPINGLIWMGDKDFMKGQIDGKLQKGYKCIKLKIGAIDFDTECELLEYIRSQYPSDKLVLRIDANGAFPTQEVLKRLERLAGLDLHSIEQPIMPKQPEAMGLVCERSPVPVALDEELIGVFAGREKKACSKRSSRIMLCLNPLCLAVLQLRQNG